MTISLMLPAVTSGKVLPPKNRDLFDLRGVRSHLELQQRNCALECIPSDSAW
jgi:hypothetical protein